MGPIPRQNYDLNGVFKGYDNLIENKSEVKIDELGNPIVHFLAVGKSDQNLDQFLTEQNKYDRNTGLIKILWAFNHIGEDYVQSLDCPNDSALNLEAQQNPKLKNLLGKFYKTIYNEVPEAIGFQEVKDILEKEVNLSKLEDLEDEEVAKIFEVEEENNKTPL